MEYYIDLGSSTIKVYRYEDALTIEEENYIYFKNGFDAEKGISEENKEALFTYFKELKEKYQLLYYNTHIYVTGIFRNLVDTRKTELIKEFNDRFDLHFQIISHDIENYYLAKAMENDYDNKKVLIFSAFSDTAEYLYDQVASFMKQKYNIDTAVITGAIDGRTTIKGLKATLNNVLTCFSPLSKGRDILMPNSTKEIDILIATDCISEGQNLQDCDYLINYDIHWNPVRIIQRFGRIDRIGSRNKYIQLVNFWPDMTLDEYINLKSRVETRMKISIMTSTGDDDLINPEEKGDLEYRKQQLQRLQNEVVDIEDMSTGISIMDLGLNEFRLDLLEYIKNHGDLAKKPKGLHAVVPATSENPEGVIFVLRNINNSVNIDNQNRIHPFYMVYISVHNDII